MIWAVADLERRRLQAGLALWIVLATAQGVIAWLAFAQLEAFAVIAPQLKASGSTIGAMDLVIKPTLNTLVLILLLTRPMLAMGTFASEARSERLLFWSAAPIAAHQFAIGKWLGLWLAGLPIVLGALATLALTGFGINMDWPRFLLAAATLLLFDAWVCAVAAWLSALVDHPAAALAAGLGLLLSLWLFDTLGAPGSPIHAAALMPRLTPAFDGLWRAGDTLFFASTLACALLLTMYRFARRRGEL